MTGRGSFEATLAAWLEDDAGGMAPTGLHAGAMRSARVVRQRPAWLVGIRRGGWNDRPVDRLVASRRLVLVVVALAILAATIAIAAGWRPNPEALVTNGRIMFARERTGQPAEYLTVRPDGTDEVAFMEADECGQCTFWSPDGRRIMTPLVVGDRLTTAVVDLDGTRLYEVPLPDASLFIGPGDWSSDGRLLALEGFDPNDPFRAEVGVWVANADGSGLHQVTFSTDGRIHGFPTFSPDGSRIAFIAEDEGTTPISPLYGDLFVVNTDGSDLRQVNPAGTKAVIAGPTGRPMAWSPDGERLAFAAIEGSLVRGLGAAYVVDIAGGTPRKVSEPGEWLVSVEWSPDGRWLVYGQVAELNAPTWIARPDGSETRQLTGPGAPLEGCCATWSPDSTRLLFRRLANADEFDLWTMNVAGAVQEQITREPARYIWYSWAPAP